MIFKEKEIDENKLKDICEESCYKCLHNFQDDDPEEFKNYLWQI